MLLLCWSNNLTLYVTLHKPFQFQYIINCLDLDKNKIMTIIFFIWYFYLNFLVKLTNELDTCTPARVLDMGGQLDLNPIVISYCWWHFKSFLSMNIFISFNPILTQVCHGSCSDPINPEDDAALVLVNLLLTISQHCCGSVDKPSARQWLHRFSYVNTRPQSID